MPSVAGGVIGNISVFETEESWFDSRSANECEVCSDDADVSESVDEAALKAAARKRVQVRVLSSALKIE